MRRQSHQVIMLALGALLVAGCAGSGRAVRTPTIGAGKAVAAPVTAQVSGNGIPAFTQTPGAIARSVDLAHRPHVSPAWYVRNRGHVAITLRNPTSRPLALTFIGWPGDAGVVPHETVAARQTMTIRFVPPCPGVFALMPARHGAQTVYGVLTVIGPHGAVDADGNPARA